MLRISVVGNSGSGKSSLARRLASLLDVPYVELDALHHLPDWQPIDAADFLALIDERTRGGGWVIDGNYRAVVVDGPVWQRADTVVWLDLTRRTVMRHVIWRTVRRVVRGEVLWNGNRERVRNLLAWDPDKSIIRWSWTQHGAYVDRYSVAMRSPEFAHLVFVRLGSHAHAERWLAGVGRPDG